MTLTEDILALAGQGPAGLNDADRIGLLAATEKLTSSLENPMERFARMFMVRRPQAHQQVSL
jgi:hypothetical protein